MMKLKEEALAAHLKGAGPGPLFELRALRPRGLQILKSRKLLASNALSTIDFFGNSNTWWLGE